VAGRFLGPSVVELKGGRPRRESLQPAGGYNGRADGGKVRLTRAGSNQTIYLREAKLIQPGDFAAMARSILSSQTPGVGDVLSVTRRMAGDGDGTLIVVSKDLKRAVRATGIGSWPGTSAREAVRTVRDLLVDGEGVGLPHCPETPARGPGAQIIGRSAGLPVDLPVYPQPRGWRVVARPGAPSRTSLAGTGHPGKVRFAFFIELPCRDGSATGPPGTAAARGVSRIIE